MSSARLKRKLKGRKIPHVSRVWAAYLARQLAAIQTKSEKQEQSKG